MMGRTIIGLLVGASAVGGTACLLMGRTVRCDDIIEQSVRSPNGEFVATSTLRTCPVGLLSSTNYSVSVTLSFNSRAASSRNQTLAFESTDTSEVPALVWVNEHELLLRVKGIGDVRASKHELGA